VLGGRLVEAAGTGATVELMRSGDEGGETRGSWVAVLCGDLSSKIGVTLQDMSIISEIIKNIM